MSTRRISLMMSILFLLGCIAAPVSAGSVRIKLGTSAPQGTAWHEVLLQLSQDWSRISGGTVRVDIYPDGRLGDEADMVEKARFGQLQAVALSGVGLSHVEPGVAALQIPMMFDSYQELDYVRDRLAPLLEERMEAKGWVVLNWGDAGWIHFFTKEPVSTPEELRRLKLFISAGDANSEALYKAAGFKPVPLAVTDILPALQTGMIEAFDVPPLLALVNQWFGLARNMVDVKWAPLVGATVIRKEAWERIPAAYRPEMRKAARAAGERLRGDIRRLGDEAVIEMQKHGLKVIEVDAETLEIWRTEAEAVYPELRGKIIPADLFDEVRRLRDEYRRRKVEGF